MGLKQAAKFSVVRGTEEFIQTCEQCDGRLYFAIDSGRMYLDKGEKRIPVGGGNGVVIHYANIPESAFDETIEQNTYAIKSEWFEDQTLSPQIGDLILNADGTFLRIKGLAPSGDGFAAIRILVSGGSSGGGGGNSNIGSSLSMTLKSTLENSSVLLNGQDFPVRITATAPKDTQGNLIDDVVKLTYKIFEYAGNSSADTYKNMNPYSSGNLGQLESGETLEYTFSNDVLRNSASSILFIYAASDNSPITVTRSLVFSLADLTMIKSSQFSNYNVFKSSNPVTLSCDINGNMDKIIEVLFDNIVIQSEHLNANRNGTYQATIPAGDSRLTHGTHTVEFRLYQSFSKNGEFVKSNEIDPIKVEIAVCQDGDARPIIWCGDYQEVYRTYDDIQIPFKVYQPGNTGEITVIFYKNGQKMEGGERSILFGNTFEIFEIANATPNATNYYSIGCGSQELEVRKDITFSVEEDKDHDMTPAQKGSLILSFDAKGRSNSESSVSRATWSNEVKGKNVSGIFEGFNWNNNGWVMDGGNTCLRISNGASFRIPYGQMRFSAGTVGDISHSFDFQFKVRNVQDYSNLIKTITRYKGDNVFYQEYVNNYQNSYDSYDSFLAWYLQTAKPNDDKKEVKYDDLEAKDVTRLISTSNMFCSYVSNISGQTAEGFGIGPQDAFFSNGTHTVSVDFVEDEMVYLTIVYDGSKMDATNTNTPMMYIYLNGVLTGVSKVVRDDLFWAIGSNEEQEIVFNSTKCDIDLYKIRFYDTALSVNDVVKNYAVDTKNITLYDQNSLAYWNENDQEYKLSYKKMLEYNEAHPRAPMMPYVIFDTTNSNSNNRLPYTKSEGIKGATMEFHNTVLEAAYTNGELITFAKQDGLIPENNNNQDDRAAAVKQYYYYHCPSFTAKDVKMTVQGTSSQFYPRKNYKVKCKGSDNIHIWIMGGPYTNDFTKNGTQQDVKEVKDEDGKVTVEGYTNPCRSDWFYMDNYTVGTTKFTMKVDYMESSGSYNMGLANAVRNAYSKQPLEDYIAAGAIDTKGQEALKSSVFPAAGIRWQDYRTSVKGYPVMAFHRKSTDKNVEPEFIGFYRMLSDKGSDEMYGFKPAKTVEQKLLGKKKVEQNADGSQTETISYPKVSKTAECWEFSDNNRGFCSFRDPWNREELSFKAPDNVSITESTTSNYAPIVADSFEYRYSQYDDALDVIYSLAPDRNWTGAIKDSDKATLLDAFGDDLDLSLTGIHGAMFKAYSNWEKACNWVWLTNQDSVISGGEYSPIALSDKKYEPSKYFIKVNEDAEGATYKICDDAEYDESKTYYTQVKDNETGTTDYQIVNLAKDDDHLYKANTFYISAGNNNYTLSLGVFDSAIQYYTFKAFTNEELEQKIAQLNANEKTKTHTKKLTERYTSEKYPGYLTEEGYAAWDKTKKYAYDTKEFRNEKFINELSSHFDKEYLAVYFIITEVLECYDSRGKNAMFASWGPLVEGGDYVWYPIFYDMDTQLGINNTGIPSFSYNVDATDEGNFSTSDSVLWTNFYKNFKSTLILDKYKQLKGSDISDWGGKLPTPIFETVDKLEKWYSADPNECNCITMRGERPLVAKNLDEFFKYIIITNNRGLNAANPTDATKNTTGFCDSDGKYKYDNGTYFYALQGDRSLSRQKFLSNRFEYIDSWLNQGNYRRNGANCLWGRVSANYANKDSGAYYTSDQWLDSNSSPYWKNGVEDFISKTHDFDSQYWVTLQPVRNTYVTLGGDGDTVYPSKKYSGTPINFVIQEMKEATLHSNLAEKLLYIYGMNQMGSVGDLYKNYWTEFKISGNAGKLNSVLLGCDGLMYDGNSVVIDNEHGTVGVGVDETGKYTQMEPSDEGYKGKAFHWFNTKVNPPSFSTEGLPLLKEANFSNITISGTDVALTGFSKSEKLQIFKAVGSNISQVDFAPGVALHTLYLPKSFTSLTLTEPKLLVNIIEKYHYPDKINGSYVSDPGLYIEGLTDFDENGSSSSTSSLSYLSIIGDAMGYDSYKLLRKFYKARNGLKQTNGNKIVSTLALTGVKWSPYAKVEKGDPYQEDKKSLYYKDDGHYGFTKLPEDYDFTKNFANDVINGEIYLLDDTYSESTYLISDPNGKDIQMFMDLMKGEYFKGTNNAAYPNIAGNLFIKNTAPINEVDIRNYFGERFPNLSVHFANVKHSYSMRFIAPDLDDTPPYAYQGTYDYIPDKTGNLLSVQKCSKDGEIKFENPWTKYVPDSVKGSNYDFKSWSSSIDPSDESSFITVDQWDAYLKKLNDAEEKPDDYTIYALYEKHPYNCVFYNIDKNNPVNSVTVLAGENLGDHIDPVAYVHPDEDSLSLEESYRFLGFTQNDNKVIVKNKEEASLVDFSKLLSVTDYRFYAVYMKVNVHDSALDSSNFTFIETSYRDEYDSSYNISGYQLTFRADKPLSGKITLPTSYNGKPIISLAIPAALSSNGNIGELNKNVTHIFWNDPNGDNPNLRVIETRTFLSWTFRYFEFPSKLRVAKELCCSLQWTTEAKQAMDETVLIRLLKAPLCTVGAEAFNSSFYIRTPTDLTFRGTLKYLGAKAFQLNGVVTEYQANTPENSKGKIPNLTFGSPDERLENITCDSSKNAGEVEDARNSFISCGGMTNLTQYISKITIYTTPSFKTTAYNLMFEREGIYHGYDSIPIDVVDK